MRIVRGRAGLGYQSGYRSYRSLRVANWTDLYNVTRARATSPLTRTFLDLPEKRATVRILLHLTRLVDVFVTAELFRSSLGQIRRLRKETDSRIHDETLALPTSCRFQTEP